MVQSAPPSSLDDSLPGPGRVPETERAFYVDEFAGSTIVAALVDGSSATLDSIRQASSSLAEGRCRLLVVIDRDGGIDDQVADALPSAPVVFDAPAGELAAPWLADLWLAITDRQEVVVRAALADVPLVGARLAVAVGARKLVLTDPAGGWGRPPRSFADVASHAEALRSQLAERQGGAVVAALQVALDGGVVNVNLCRPEDLDAELFTFDGVGTLFTSGAYVELGPLRVDDLTAVERLVAQGTADGLLRPRSRAEVARLAVDGLGAKVVGSGHLAGIVSLDVDTYQDHAMGEVACLYTVSRFSGAGAGSMLVDGLIERATQRGIGAVFAVTVSDLAAEFFARKGFHEVPHETIPPAKWAGYDPARLVAARAFLRDVAAEAEQASLGF